MLDHDIDLVAVFHFKAVRRIVVLDSLSIENEAALIICETLSLAVGIHQFLQLSGPFDLKVNFGSILSLNLDIDVLGARVLRVSTVSMRGRVVVRTRGWRSVLA